MIINPRRKALGASLNPKNLTVVAQANNNSFLDSCAKSLLIVLVIFFLQFSLYGQQNKVDSLKNILRTAKEDTNKVNTLNKLGREMELSGDYEKGINYAKEAIQLGEKINYKKGIAAAYKSHGNINIYQGNYAEALKYYFASLKLSEELNDKIGIAKTLSNIGSVYREQSDYPKALDYSFKALKMAEELGNKNGIAIKLGNIGNIYAELADYPKALDYYFKALKIDEELGDKSGIASGLGNIGIVYDDQADYPKALDYYFKALKMMEELGNKHGIAINLGNIGSVYRNQADYPKALDYDFKALKLAEELGLKQLQATALGNIAIVYDVQAAASAEAKARAELFTKALHYYFKALKIDEEQGDKNGIAINLGNIGSLYITIGNADRSVSTKKYKEAEEYLNKALALSKEIGALACQRDFEKTYSVLDSVLSKKEVGLGNFALAIKYSEASIEHYKKYIAARDSIANDENTKKQTRAEMNFEFDKKETIAKEEQEKKDALAAAETKKQRIVLILVSCFLVLVIVLAFIIFRSLRINQHKNKIISHQKEVVEKQKEFVEEKQKEILDSIHYAKRIQTALITSEKYIARHLARHREF
ncbi:MAG: tetratricopeptide repeat protein [Bacteroidetes bacterium]|nr:tetratricopeptide repeat protein [Bacteroidota bacterium]